MARSLALVLSSGLGLAVAASAHAGAQTAPERLTDDVYPDRIEVQFVPGSGIRVDGGELLSRRGVDLTTLRAALRGARIEPLIRRPLATLDRWHALASAARRADATADPVPHLGLWARVVASDATRAERVIAELRRHPLVREAYLEPVPSLPNGNDIPPATPDFRSRQGYLDAPPLGIHTERSRVLVGGRGRGVQVTDMEVYWNIPHEDICKLSDPNVWAGRPSSGSGDHGTAVVGEMTSDRNGYGTKGIVDEIGLKISSWNDGGVANAIANGINVSQPGDVILLEVHYRTNQGFVPAEAFTSNYNVIVTATSMGIHVTEAAGNGNVNLDTLSINGQPPGFLDPQSPNFRDSGAVMCGATDGEQLARASFSNYGNRITSNGWGRRVTTTAYGGLFNGGGDQRQEYTSTFSGTSSASPIVTGAVAAVLGAVEFQDDRDVTIDEMRQLLRNHGTPVSGNVGTRPDLAAMLASLGLPDGLRMLDERTAPGGSIEMRLSGPPGGAYALLLATRIEKVDYGFNRQFHLPLAEALNVGAFSLDGSGNASASVDVPNIPELHDRSIYFQGFDVDAALTAVHIGSSAEAWLF